MPSKPHHHRGSRNHTPMSSARSSPAITPRAGRSRHVSPLCRPQSTPSSRAPTPLAAHQAPPSPQSGAAVRMPALPRSTASRETSASRASSQGPRQKHKKKDKKKDKKNNSSHNNNAHVATVPTDAVGATTLSLLSLHFSRVELTFQLHLDRAQRSSLFPRDIGNLLLWSVPSAIPLIESPRIFFIKNKSKLRDVVVLYVNGWSYDQMMCTGVGLPRATTQDGEIGSVSVGQKRAREEEQGGDAVTTPLGETHAAAPLAHWNEKICHAMLRPVRQGLCWARVDGGAVQYCPLIIPSVKNALEQDLFWRNDAPRVPGARQNRPSQADGVGSSDHANETDKPMRSVRGMFEKAMEIHSNTQSPVSGNEAARTLPVPPSDDKATEQPPALASSPPSSSVTATTTADAVVSSPVKLWDTAALLEQYALRLPSGAAALTELGFTLEPPTESDVEDEQGEDDDGEEKWRLFPAADANTSLAASVPRVFAFDCEMVLAQPRTRRRRCRGGGSSEAAEPREDDGNRTAEGVTTRGVSVLARATLVDVRTGDIVLDELVKPQTPVVDYLTRFSGIDESSLASVTTTLTDCQRKLQALIHTDTYVVGHSLENDFKACKMLPNCRVLDTAWLYPHPSGLPYKNSLRFLAQRYLNKRIQQGAHDSSIDAITSAELVLLKLEHGPEFGVRKKVSVLGLIADAAVAEQEAGAESVPGRSHGGGGGGVHIQLFDDATNLVSIVPKSTTAGGGGAAIDAIPVRHDEDATRKVVRALRRRRAALEEAVARTGQRDEALAQQPYSLMWVQLTETDVDVVVPTTADAVAALPTATEAQRDAWRQSHEAQQLEKVAAVNRRVMQIVEACADETMVVLLAGACGGEATGNHFSRAQGSCFAFIKDSTADGPPPEPESQATSPPHHQHNDGAAGDDVKSAETQGPAPPKPTPRAKDVRAALAATTPPACEPS